MKKVLLPGLCVLLAACASGMQDVSYPCEGQQVYEIHAPEYEIGCPIVTVEQLPCQNTENNLDVNPCKCVNSEPLQEVLRPRITEKLPVKPRRNCPKDKQVINCGCGDCSILSEDNEQDNSVKEVIPAMPEAYKLASSRVFSRFVKDTGSVYGAKPNVLLYVKPIEVKSDDLPAGAAEGVALFKRKLLASFTYAVTDDENNNDYYLETYVDWFDTISKTIPAIKYTVILYAKDGNIVGTWVEIVKKAENSKTWL